MQDYFYINKDGKSDGLFFELSLLILISLPLASLFGHVQKNILHLPNVYSLLRDCIIFFLFFINIFQYRGLVGSKKILALICYFFFVSYYCLICLYEHKIYEGLYFLRLYSLPVLFFLITISVLDNSSDRFFYKAVKFIIATNIIVDIVSIFLYIKFRSDMAFQIKLMGAGALHGAWRISGSQVIRLGLPLSGPNTMGLYLAVNVFLLILLLKERILENKKIYSLIIIDLILIVLTFSRSSMLFLVIAFCIIAIFRFWALFVRYVKYTAISIFIIIAGYMAINYESNGAVSTWINLNLSLEDPSLHGHADSIFDAFRNMDKYFLTGFPKGTVSAKSLLFTKDIINVENSFLAVMYDAGLIGFILLMMTYIFLVRRAIININQASFLIAFVIVLQFLPHIFETEIIMYSIFIFALLSKCSDIKSALNSDVYIDNNHLQLINS